MQNTLTRTGLKPSSRPAVFIDEPRVLVGIVYTHHKQYCRFLYPKIFEKLTYANKEIAFVDEKNYPQLMGKNTGEERAAGGRQILIEIARAEKVDWLFMLDVDTEPDPDIIERMLAVNHPIVGGLHAARGNPWRCIGHNYTDRKTLERVWLKKTELKGNPTVDGISGGTLLVARGVFSRVDYSGYIGPGTIPGRYTADDEYFLIRAFLSLKIRPKVCSDAKSWHYSDDGRAYRLWGRVRQWREF